MDCRKFHKNLEDYLEGGLDFPGRFGMERHARQCYSCGCELSGAQKIARMAQELKRVSAPPDFEAAVLRRIQARGTRTRFRALRRFWVYGLDNPSWRIVTAGVAAMVLVGFLVLLTARRPAPATSSSRNPEKGAPVPHRVTAAPPAEAPIGPFAAEDSRIAPVTLRSPRAQAGKLAAEKGFAPQIEPSDYVDYLVPGPGDRQMIVRLPKTILMRYGQPSEEYYIRNVSH